MWITTNCGKFLEMGIPSHLTCFLRNLYAGQEATVRTRNGTTDFQNWKGVHQGCILSLCLFNLYASTSSKMWGWMIHKVKSRLPGELSTTSDVIDTTLMAESEEELKSFLMKVKRGECKSWLKTQH